ncbi:natural killer cell receptor 2B4 [Tupaia chinensis]|uniref:natural killer cell receptor 2B4 n=1 Tax=Tupaia chinensis TaxID=246437 RepID=UPI000FFB5EF3|nr:natural killer cell receptor 2B4 [Tupaia chinensis]
MGNRGHQSTPTLCCGILKRAVTLLFLLLEGYQGQVLHPIRILDKCAQLVFTDGACDSPGSTDVVHLTGEALRLRPCNLQMADSVQWKVKLHSPPGSEYHEILTWKNLSSVNSTPSPILDSYKNRVSFIVKDLALLIRSPQQNDSGLYCVEVTGETGTVSRAAFRVFVFDQVKKPCLLGWGKVLDREKCQVALSCSVSNNVNVSYAWYRGSQLIQRSRNLTHLEEQVNVSGDFVYTCNVSNPVSWNTSTINVTRDCQSGPEGSRFLIFLVTIVILTTLFLGALTFFYVWRRRKQSEPSSKEILTVYEDIKDLRTGRNQESRLEPEPEQEQEQDSPGDKNTIYSMIQPQVPLWLL